MAIWDDEPEDDLLPEDENEGDGRPSRELRTPDEILNKQIYGYERLLKKAVREVRKDPLSPMAGEIFKQYDELKKNRIFDYVDINDKMLQLMQHNVEELMDDLLLQDDEEAYRTAAGLYGSCLDVFLNESGYDPKNIEEMIGSYGPRILDTDNIQDQYFMAAEALQRTLTMQEKLLEKNVISARKTAEFLLQHTPKLLIALPDATESGVHELPVIDAEGNDMGPLLHEERSVVKARHEIHYTYSYAFLAEEMYGRTMNLIQKIMPNTGVPKFLKATQPALSVALANKEEETHTINLGTGTIDTRRFPNTEAAIGVMGVSLKAVKEKAPKHAVSFLEDTYVDFSGALIENGQVAVLMAYYDAAYDVLSEEDDRNAMRDAYATRNIYKMMEIGDDEAAGIFLNHLHKKSGLQPSQMLLLLDVEKKKIVGASVPIMKNGKVRQRASVLYQNDAAQTMTKIIFDSRNPEQFVSYSAKDRELTLTNHFAFQAKEMSDKIQANGLNAEHQTIGTRFRAVDCRNI